MRRNAAYRVYGLLCHNLGVRPRACGQRRDGCTLTPLQRQAQPPYGADARAALPDTFQFARSRASRRD